MEEPYALIVLVRTCGGGGGKPPPLPGLMILLQILCLYPEITFENQYNRGRSLG